MKPKDDFLKNIDTLIIGLKNKTDSKYNKENKKLERGLFNLQKLKGL